MAQRLEERAAELDVPILILHGGDDRAMDLRGSEMLAERAPGPATLKVYPGMYHEVHNEVGRAEVLEDVAAWIEARVADGVDRGAVGGRR